MKHIAKSLKESLKRAGLYEGVKSVKVLEIWPLVVGDKIANKTETTFINKGVLYVKVFSSTWRQELQIQQKEIINKINKRLKENIVREIKFK